MTKAAGKQLQDYERELAKLLNVYHPGEEALARLREREPRIDRQIAILQVAYAVERDLEMEKRNPKERRN